jgi:CheY-like chemotaxis protein
LVAQATDGIDAIAKAVALSPDIIAMDYQMLEMDGREAARRLAADERTRGISILLLSSQPDTIPRDIQLGCAAILAKPCTPDELGSLLRMILASRPTRQNQAG